MFDDPMVTVRRSIMTYLECRTVGAWYRWMRTPDLSRGS